MLVLEKKKKFLKSMTKGFTLKILKKALADVVQFIGVSSSHTPRSGGFDSWSGRMPGLQAQSLVGACRRQAINVSLSHQGLPLFPSLSLSLSLFLYLPLPLSKKINFLEIRKRRVSGSKGIKNITAELQPILLSIGSRTEGSQVQFQSRAHTLVAGSTPNPRLGLVLEANNQCASHTAMFLCLSPSLPLSPPPKKNQWEKYLQMRINKKHTKQTNKNVTAEMHEIGNCRKS
uniref:Uncharacterized protein n=1 Tax=Pipistrellus kuhlii TaxID=59472 RepID=A0A7J7XCA9_PIPKU|nr:hypothetical protein mPipKuh1_010670 [Pipistrellus kuhlii]